MNDVERWLEPRLAGVPEALRERIVSAVDGERETGKEEGYDRGSTLPRSPFSLPESLRQAGERLLAAAQAAPPSRDAAVTLLAADALMTFACEAMGEEAPERLADLR